MNNAESEQNNNQEQLEQVAQRLAGQTSTTASGDLDLLASVGGIRGIAEAILPALIFLVAFMMTTNVWISVHLDAANG